MIQVQDLKNILALTWLISLVKLGKLLSNSFLEAFASLSLIQSCVDLAY
jgi:hypothetical protein